MIQEKLSKTWYKKWWLIPMIIVIIISSFLFLMLSKLFKEINPIKSQISVDSKKGPNATTNKELKNLNYQIVYQVDKKRYDGGKNYYVLVNNIDFNTTDFKSTIKMMIDDIVQTKGEKISIDFVTNKEALNLIYKSHYGTNELGRILTEKELDKIGESLIAAFSGKLETGLYSNTLYFFPGTFTTNQKVGKYVDTIEYNPHK